MAHQLVRAKADPLWLLDRILAQAFEEAAVEEQEDSRVAHAIWRAAYDGLAVYEALVENDDDVVREAARSLVARLSEYGPDGPTPESDAWNSL